MINQFALLGLVFLILSWSESSGTPPKDDQQYSDEPYEPDAIATQYQQEWANFYAQQERTASTNYDYPAIWTDWEDAA